MDLRSGILFMNFNNVIFYLIDEHYNNRLPHHSQLLAVGTNSWYVAHLGAMWGLLWGLFSY
jgi:hypothetical protein